MRQTGTQGSLPCRGLTHTGAQDIPHDDLVHILRIDFGLLKGGCRQEREREKVKNPIEQSPRVPEQMRILRAAKSAEKLEAKGGKLLPLMAMEPSLGAEREPREPDRFPMGVLATAAM